MRLSDAQIIDYLDRAELIILGPRTEFPFDAKRQVQPCSIDLRLDSNFFRFRDGIDSFDVRDLGRVNDFIDTFRVEDKQPISIPPGSVLFGQIYEQIRLPSTVSGKIVGRSRFARLGLAIHATGDFINPEFEGAMPLQLINHNRFPVVVYPMLSICQLVLVELTSKPITPYPMRSDIPYHRERRASPSVLHTDPILQSGDSVDLADAIRERMLDAYVRQRSSTALIRDISTLFEDKDPKLSDRNPTFNITNSTIGMLNSESALSSASAVLNARTNNLSHEASTALRAILEFLSSGNDGLAPRDRDEAANLVSDVVKQLNLPKEQQASSGSLRVMAVRIAELIKTSAAGSTLWQHWGQHLLSLFS